MTFLHPLALFGLATAAIPALLHLLQRRVPPESEFPPLKYLREAERQSARRLKLRHLLLLLLRTALLALIVLAAARPLWPTRGGTGGVHAPTALVVILDNSPSADAIVDGRPLLDRLKGAARASLAQATPADRLWLVLADGVARAGSREVLLAAVDSCRVAPWRLDLTAATAVAVRLVGAEPLAAREVHVASDLQRTALGPGRVAATAVELLVLDAAVRIPANRGVAAVRVSDGAVAVSVTGTPSAGPAPVTVRLRGRDVGRALVRPGASVTVPLPPLGPGWWVGEAVLDPDELRLDDRRPFVVRVAPPARVAAAADAGPFVTAALSVLRQGRRVADGADVSLGERPGAARSVVLPPADAVLLGQANRVLGSRGVTWRFGLAGTPGPIAAPGLEAIAGVAVGRRYRLEPATEGQGGERAAGAADSAVLATVNGEPWLVRDGNTVLVGSRLDTAWTALPATPGFVPFLDALVNRLVRGEADVADSTGPAGVAFRTRGADTLGVTVFGLDPRESDLTPATPQEVRRALPGAQVLDEAGLRAARFAGTRRVDASGLLLGLALLVAAVELAVASLAR